MDERTKFAFESAQDVTKQLISLATGVMALTITFAKDFIGSAPDPARPWAYASWFFFVLSILCGLWSLMAMTGSLSSAATKVSTVDRNITLPAGIQVVAFGIAMVLTLVFGGVTVTSLPKVGSAGTSERHDPGSASTDSTTRHDSPPTPRDRPR